MCPFQLIGKYISKIAFLYKIEPHQLQKFIFGETLVFQDVSKQLSFVNHSYVSSSQPNTAFRDNLTSQTVNTLFNFATGLSLALRITARTQPTFHFRWKKRKIREYLFIYFFDVYFSIQKPFKKNKNTQNVLLSWITLSYVFLRQT